MKSLKSFLYDDNKNYYIKRFTIENKFKLKTNLKDLISQIYSIQKAEEVLAYSIEYENDFTVKYFDNEKTPIQSLPALVNIQIKPKKEHRVCIIRKEPVFNDDEENDQNYFSFIVEFFGDLNIFIEIILNYLYHNKTERNLFKKKDYCPKLYTFDKNEFIEIKDIEIINANKLKPVFLIWKCQSIYDIIITLFSKAKNEDELEL